MEKKYITPEIKVIRINSIDILTTSPEPGDITKDPFEE